MKDISMPKNEILDLTITSLENTIQFVINIKPHSHSPAAFKFVICKVINKIKSTGSFSSDKPMQILQNNIVNLPTETIPNFPSKNSTQKNIFDEIFRKCTKAEEFA
ncbi:hypothetical protein HZS_340 [Henneguya salminicola]|nr:hypothetical protein HZS_340 [Henneguya salminicola]